MSTTKAAIVTGASYGLGHAIAVGLAADGFDVVITDMRAADLANTARVIEAKGRRALALELDVRDMASIDRTWTRAIDAFGAIDVLVNNAGVQSKKRVVDATPEEWDEVIGVNLKGAYFMSQRLGRHLIARKQPGCIVSLSSTFGVLGFPERSLYGIAKGGIAQMTRMLAIEWAPHGIRVNAIGPGTIETESRAAALADPVAREVMLKRIPLGRFGQPEEVAGTVRYLVSPAGAYVSGQVLMLDGALSAQ